MSGTPPLPPLPENAHATAHRVADAVAHAWHSHYGTDRLAVPMSVVAALALISEPCHDTVRDGLLESDRSVFAATVRDVWHGFMRVRPDLINRVWPLIEPWEPGAGAALDDGAVDAARQVAGAAMKAGQSILIRPELYHDVDLFGPVLTRLRPRAALTARGQFYTPSEVCGLIAGMTIDALGDAICDAACGTGGMFRSAAAALRADGQDPATKAWVGCDLDELAVACCAVNAVLWGLGTNVLLGVGDALTDDWLHRARAERAETVHLASALTWFGQVARLLTPSRSQIGPDSGERLGDTGRSHR